MEIESGREVALSDRLNLARHLLRQVIEILVQEGLLIAAAQAQHAHDSCAVEDRFE